MAEESAPGTVTSPNVMDPDQNGRNPPGFWKSSSSGSAMSFPLRCLHSFETGFEGVRELFFLLLLRTERHHLRLAPGGLGLHEIEHAGPVFVAILRGIELSMQRL